MAKKNKRGVNPASILSGDEINDALNNGIDNQAPENKQKRFWSRLSGGERIGLIAVILFLTLGTFGAGLKYLENSAKQQMSLPASEHKNDSSYLSKLNPFSPPAPPLSATPQLSKEYIYAGSRMLAVEDANAVAAPPADLAVFRPSNGTWYVMGGQGSTPTTVAWGQNNDIPVPGDFDGDGKTDFSVFRPSTGYWYVSNSSNGNTTAVFFGTSTDKVAQADYDGDGKTDIAVFREQSPDGWWYISPSSNPSGIISYQFGLSSDKPAPADYDGDGKADYAVWRGAIKTFYIKRSSDNQLQIITMPNTVTDGTPVSADYDGDGKADAAIRSTALNNNKWYILPSSGGALIPVPWQDAADKAVQNDYDGDGKVDIAVWRPSIGWWFIRQSSKVGQVDELRNAQWGGVINGVEDIPVPAFYRR